MNKKSQTSLSTVLSSTASNMLQYISPELLGVVVVTALMKGAEAYNIETGEATPFSHYVGDPTYPTFNGTFESEHTCPYPGDFYAGNFDKFTHVKYVTDQLFDCFQKTGLLDYCVQNFLPKLGDSTEVVSFMLNKLSSGDRLLTSCDTEKCITTLFMNNITEYSRVAGLLENSSSNEAEIQPSEILENILALLPDLKHAFENIEYPLNSVVQASVIVPGNENDQCAFTVNYAEQNQKNTSDLLSFITGLSKEVVEGVINGTIETITGTEQDQITSDVTPTYGDLLEVAVSSVGSSMQECLASLGSLLGYGSTDVTDFEA